MKERQWEISKLDNGKIRRTIKWYYLWDNQAKSHYINAYYYSMPRSYTHHQQMEWHIYDDEDYAPYEAIIVTPLSYDSYPF